MDNEEIRKLLQELKKNSDESTAVRSKVVKIHFDTPQEAARRRKAKERAEAEEARRKLEEEEKARAAEEARRLEAERMAQEVVEEAKQQAKSGFSPDLEQDLYASSMDDPGEEAGENIDDLDLNWEYERPRLSSDDLYEDEEPEEEDPDYMPDSDEFREGIIPDDSNPLRSALGAITGGFAALTERLRERGPKEDAGEEADASEVDEDKEDTAAAPEEDIPSEEEGDGEKKKTGFRFFGKRKDTAEETEEDTGIDAGEAEEESPADEESDPDEEWKRRMEEPPRYNLKRRRIPKKPAAGRIRKSEPAAAAGAEPSQEEADQEEADQGVPDDLSFSYDAQKPDTVAEGSGTVNETLPGEPAGYDTADYADRVAEKPETQPEGEAVPEKSIEVIDLEEKTNRKEAEVIPLDTGSTGPLPRIRAGRLLSGKKTAPPEKSGGRKRLFSRKNEQKAEGEVPETTVPKEEGPHETWQRIRDYAVQHRRALLIGLAAALLLILAIGALALILPRLQSRRRAVIREDEGLSLQILSQPDEFTPEGDISLRVKAPETIQSVTINGENVNIEQGRTVDLDYHATTGALEVMVVSTDKVRSADITLAYVDSAPPVVTVSEKDGMIELSAEDKETGVKAIYVGRNDVLSNVPMYEEYTEPIPADPDEVLSYYAVDEAGNSSTPVIAAMTPAESIAFSQNRYGIFPGSETDLEIITEPANAFVNNLKFEVENDKIAKVNGNTLTGISEGDTKITASADGLSPVTASVSVKKDRSVTISAVGDCTFGTDINLSSNTSFNAYQAMYGNSYFFEKVRTILSQDDATFANFEGTLTTSDERKDKPFAFKGDPSFAEILADGSVEVVTLANNHSSDYGEQSHTDTKNALEAAGVKWCEGDDIAYMDLNGVKTAFIGIYALENGLESMDQVKNTVAEAKANGADLVIMHFHWGVELVTTLDDFERQLSHAAIDAGADLVVGTHAHMILPIEKYNGRYIVYGLANFCFGGNAYPHSYDSMIWQQTFTFTPDGLESEDDISIIPCRVSSDYTINNYQPMPVTGDEADAIMQTIDSLSSEFGLSFSQYKTDGTAIAG